ncbi:MAG: efflux RND transporter periplasmic adaptor subunit [Acidobacteria bacterium]|nr:efflux RND transporter periplasmic adaptor subunit [Acidobacteriota bacterium]
MKHVLWILPVALIAAGIWWAVQIKNGPVEVRYTVAKTGPLVDTLITNGKVEPVAYTGVRAERAGVLARLRVEKGQEVAAGAVIAEIESAEWKNALEAAEARVAQIQAELNTQQSGGRASDLADIDGQLAKLLLERQQAEKELAAVRRLIEKNAATKQEAQVIEDRIAQIQQQRNALQSRRAVLFTPADRGVLEARLREARTAVANARDKQAQGILRTPIGGVVYQVDPRAGAFLNPGDLVANIGKVDELLVKVFVDEPELGRVAPGMGAVITWDAMPGKHWSGVVEKLPVQIVTMGTRQVGEVSVRIKNADRTLPPGANINAAIRSREAATAVIIPKESLRRENGVQGVYAITDNALHWRPVKIGVTNITHAQVEEGVKAGEHVVLATDAALRTGQVVKGVSEDAAH